MTAPLIVGGGPAGSAAAIILAKAGINSTLVERTRNTGDAICGGFLSWRTLETLNTLGLERSDLGGHSISHLRLFAGLLRADAPLPHPAIGISRHRLDSLLLAKARALGAKVERGVTVREILPGAVRLDDGAEIAATGLFLANGKHDIRGGGRPRMRENTIGLRAMLEPSPALAALIGSSIELHLFEGGYCGILINETGHANVCLAVCKDRLVEVGGDPAALLTRLGHENPALGERLAFSRIDGIDAISAIPYGWIAQETVNGVFRLGDQAAVIPSLAGEGNGIALASGIAAARAWREGGAAAAISYQTNLARSTRRPVNTAMRLWRWGERPTAARLATRVTALFPRIAAHFATMTRIEP